MVDGSNESLEHADQEYDPILRKGITLQNSFEKVDVAYTCSLIRISSSTSRGMDFNSLGSTQEWHTFSSRHTQELNIVMYNE